MTKFTTEDWREVEKLFIRASELSAIEAERLVQSSPVANAIKREVFNLLGTQGQVDQVVANVVKSGQSLLHQPLNDGEVIGRYQIQHKIASGGMGTVYQALDTRLDREVAIKFIHPHLTDDVALKQRFFGEAQAASQVEHINVCTVYEVDETPQGLPYIVMALGSGHSLQNYLVKEGITLDHIMDVALQLAEALSAVHDAGIVHRDLKPSNVLVNDDNRLKLIDFGISKAIYSDATHSTHLLGTIAYMAPELFQGKAPSIASDIWAFGVVLYELIAGINPFQCEDQAQSLTRIAHGRVADLSNLLPDLPPQFNQLVMRCLSIDWTERPIHCREIIASLRECRNNFLDLSIAGNVLLRTAISGNEELQNTSTRAERRNITVVNVLIATDDVTQQELLLRELKPFREHCEKIAGVHGGHVHRLEVGQCILYFGYPRADEHAVKKSIRCALSLYQSLEKKLAEVTGLQIKLGVHTGMMIISRGESATDDNTLLGNATRMAEQLVYNSESAGVFISSATYQLAKNYFYCSPLTDNNNAYRVITDKSDTSFNMDTSVPDTPLVGRNNELGILKDYWQRASEGEFQIVELVGEAGIGKTRLTHELKKYVLDTPTFWISEGVCDPVQSNVALHPIIAYLERSLAELSSDDEDRLATLKTYLTRFDIPLEDAVPVFARLLQLDIDSATTEANNEHDSQKLLHYLQKIVTVRAKLQPFLLIFEDLHWADATTLEFIKNLIETNPATSLMLLLTRRTECITPWAENASVTRLSLQNLSKRHAREFLALSLEGKPISEQQLNQLLEICDGNPLYLEELGKSCDGASKGMANGFTGVPNSLQDLLLSRVDSLGLSKTLVQLGAVVGREFSYDIIRSLSGISHDSLLQAMFAKLTQADILRPADSNRSVTSVEQRYRFKHALIQEAVYGALLDSERERLHGEIAAYYQLQAQHGVSVAAQVIARHFASAKQFDAALHYWILAAKDCLRLSAYKEAEESLQLAVQALRVLPLDEVIKRKELDIRLMLVQVVRALQGWTAERIGEHYRRAVELSAELNLPQEEATIIFGLWTYYLIKLDLIKARDLATEFVELAARLEDSGTQLQSALTLGNTQFWIGDLTAARENLSGLVETYDVANLQEHIQRFGQDPRILVLLIDVLLEWLLGENDQAEIKFRNMLSIAESSNHPFTLAIALQGGAWFEHHRGDVDKVSQYANRLVTLTDEYGFVFYQGVGLMFQGWANYMQARANTTNSPEEKRSTAAHCVAQIDDGYFTYIKGSGEGRVFHSLKVWLQADILVTDGQYETALAAIAVGLDVAYECEEKVYLSELLRLKSLCLAKLNKKSQALAQLQAARDICLVQNNPLFLKRVEQQLQTL